MPSPRSSGTPDYDRDIKKKKSTAKANKAKHDANAKLARKKSTSPIRGMDGVDADGTQRFNYNWSKAQSGRNQLMIDSANSEQAKRDKSRAQYTQRIGKRMGR
jgi:hypothetical protein